MDSPYDVLGLDADADEADIERAYRRRVKETHPDRGGSAVEFRRVREAYEAVVSGAATPPSAVESSEPSGADPVSGTERPDDGEAKTAADRDRGEEPGTEAETDDRERMARVEYLDYEVLADHGWSLDDGDLFERAADAGLAHDDHGVFLAEPGETLLEAAENRGFAWPYACRGGACANCAVAVLDGDLDASVDNILSNDLVERGFRLSCIGRPVTGDMRVVFNVKHLPGLEELRLPADRFERARADD